MPATDRSDFRDALRRRPILLDAAMGTRLIARGLTLATDDLALWVLGHPDRILEVHLLDAEAGADALLTCTFGANRGWLDRFDRGRDVRAINWRAVELARVAAGPGRYLIGSIGPTASGQPGAFLEQVDALLEAGVDALLLETHALGQAEAALRLLRGVPTPILASLFDWPDPVADPARRLIDLGAWAIGANCQPGIRPALDLARMLRAATDHPILLKPSAGLPGSPLEPPEFFGAAVPELVALGVRLIGGCCGTTEAHVAALKVGLKSQP